MVLSKHKQLNTTIQYPHAVPSCGYEQIKTLHAEHCTQTTGSFVSETLTRRTIRDSHIFYLRIFRLMTDYGVHLHPESSRQPVSTELMT